MKANKIYLERLRKNDFVSRSEDVFVFSPLTLEKFAQHLVGMAKILQGK